MVDVRIHSKKSLKDNLHDIEKILGKRDPKVTRENPFIVELVFHPSHQKLKSSRRCQYFEIALEERKFIQKLVLRKIVQISIFYCRVELIRECGHSYYLLFMQCTRTRK